MESPFSVAKMLGHDIEPITEIYPFDPVNEAMDKLRNGKPKYRLVLKY